MTATVTVTTTSSAEYGHESAIERIDSATRRGFVVPVCPLGPTCCGAIIVARRAEPGGDWSEPHYSWTSPSQGSALHAQETVRALRRALELGAIIPREV